SALRRQAPGAPTGEGSGNVGDGKGALPGSSRGALGITRGAGSCTGSTSTVLIVLPIWLMLVSSRLEIMSVRSKPPSVEPFEVSHKVPPYREHRDGPGHQDYRSPPVTNH